MRAGDGIVQTDRDHLAPTLDTLLSDPARRAQLATNGRAVIRSNQGATQKHVELILALLDHAKE